MTDEIILKYDFLDDDEIDFLLNLIESKENGIDYVVQHGPAEGTVMANYVTLTDNRTVTELIHNKLKAIFKCEFIFSLISRTKLYKPWDIHADYFLNQNPKGYEPFYNCLLSLNDVESRTIVFDQYTESKNDFYIYKQNNSESENPISETFWNENLDFCWPEDRKFLSLKKVMPYQRKGMFQAFPSKYFHSSDNFHRRINKPKEFLQIRTNRKLG